MNGGTGFPTRFSRVSTWEFDTGFLWVYFKCIPYLYCRLFIILPSWIRKYLFCDWKCGVKNKKQKICSSIDSKHDTRETKNKTFQREHEFRVTLSDRKRRHELKQKRRGVRYIGGLVRLNHIKFLRSFVDIDSHTLLISEDSIYFMTSMANWPQPSLASKNRLYLLWLLPIV